MAFAPNKASTDGRDVSFLTDDSVHLRGIYRVPRDEDNISVLLLHDFKGDRAAWKPFIPAFRSRGWGIFALDLRGHGDSLRQDMRSEGALSARARLAFARALSGRRQGRDCVAFTSTDGLRGANIVQIGIQSFANSRHYTDVARDAGITVITVDEVRARELAGQGGFSPRSCYLMYAQHDAGSSVSAHTFLSSTSLPKDAFVYADATSTGIDLYNEKFPEIAARTIAWIERTC